MKDALSNTRTGDSHHHATDISLLENPMEFLEEDHLRTRTVCTSLERLAEAAIPTREDVFEVLSYLENELPLFIVDEDADLDRLLRAHADEDTTLLRVLGRVAEMHREVAFRSRPAIDVLHILKRVQRPLTRSEQSCLRDLAKVLRTDMAVENSKLLPLAGKLLTKDDLAELRSAIFQRRLSDFRDRRAPGA